MPAESLKELILQDIEAVLAGIVAGATYHNTIVKVVRYADWDDDAGEYPALCLIGLDSVEDDTKFAGRQWCTLNFTVIGFLEQWTNLERDTSRLGDDVKRALLVDHTRSGLAYDTHVTNIVPFLTEGNSPRAGVTVRGSVNYRHLRGDPYTQA